jgi:hypothetical protein
MFAAIRRAFISLFLNWNKFYLFVPKPNIENASARRMSCQDKNK